VARARAVGDEETLLAVLFAAGSAQAIYAPPAERAAVSRELAALALARGDLVLAQHGYTRLAVDCADLGDLAGVELAVRAQERVGAALGHARWRWRGALLRAMLALARGDWDEARRAEGDAAAFVAEAEDPAAWLALVIHRIGSLRARGANIEQFVEVAMNAPRGGGGDPVMRELTRASINARLGDLAGARQAVEATPAWPPQFHSSPPAPALLADVAIRLGDRRLAAAALADLERLAPDWPAVSWGVFGFIWDGPLARWTGGCLAVLERWDEAAAALEEGLALAESAGARPAAEEIARELTAVKARLSAAPSPAFSLSRDGDVWTVSSGGRVAHLKHARGLEILAELVAQPGREIHVLDLGARDPQAVVDAGDAGEVLDAAAKQSYRRRIADLEAELAQAEGWNDAGRKERALAELELLRDEIARGVGLGGRDRRAAAAVERARVNVQKRLRAAIKKISESLPELARHLEVHVKTGIYVMYRPDTTPG